LLFLYCIYSNRHCWLDPQSLEKYDGLVGAGFACPKNEGEQTSPLRFNGRQNGLRVKPAMTVKTIHHYNTKIELKKLFYQTVFDSVMRNFGGVSQSEFI